MTDTVAGLAATERTTEPDENRRRPWWLWAGTFVIFTVVLVVRNAFLFSTRVYEMADLAANSILIEQARRFQLLVGDYSRLGFHHPGPAYLYVQAAGEQVFYYWLHVVPTPWNGQVLMVFMLNAAFLAMGVTVCYGWRQDLLTALGALAVFGWFTAIHPAAMSSDWLSYEYVVPFLVFMVAAASVAAGHGRDAWIMTLSGWLLIHGQATFLLFIPVITLVVLVAIGWRVRRAPLAGVAGFFRDQRRIWVPVVAISAVFLLPIVLELILHWPGYFKDYLTYSSSTIAGGHSLHRSIRYVLWYWWTGRHALWLAVFLYLLAIAATVMAGVRRSPLTGFLVSLLAVDVVTSLVMVWYTDNSIDQIDQQYIGYFYWGAVALPILVVALALTDALARQPVVALMGTLAAAGAVVITVTAFAVQPFTRTGITYSDPAVAASGRDTDPLLPQAIALMTKDSPRRPLVLHLGRATWSSAVGLLILAEREGVPACLAGNKYEFIVTSEFVCSVAQVNQGANYNLMPPDWTPTKQSIIVLASGWLETRLPGKAGDIVRSVTK
jgi:hypothetical protein